MQGKHPFSSSKHKMNRIGFHNIVPTCVWILTEGENPWKDEATLFKKIFAINNYRGML